VHGVDRWQRGVHSVAEEREVREPDPGAIDAVVDERVERVEVEQLRETGVVDGSRPRRGHVPRFEIGHELSQDAEAVRAPPLVGLDERALARLHRGHAVLGVRREGPEPRQRIRRHGIGHVRGSVRQPSTSMSAHRRFGTRRA
jgi:hypothetical protein